MFAKARLATAMATPLRVKKGPQDEAQSP